MTDTALTKDPVSGGLNGGTLPSEPQLGPVIAEQLRTVGIAVRREFLALAALSLALVAGAALVALVPSVRIQVDGDLPLRLNPADLGYLAALIAAVAPLAVWKDEGPWTDNQLWRLPVDRPRHALVKAGAGWIWVMAVVAIGLAGIVASIVLIGGSLGIEVTRLLVVDPVAAAAGGAAGTVPVEWSTPWYAWVRPFTAATAAYLGGTALWLGTRHPWRWLVGGWVVLGIFVGLVEFSAAGPWESVFQVGLGSLDHLFTGGAETLREYSRTASGEGVSRWRSLPTAAGWAAHSALWIGIGLLSAVGGAFRHREG